MNPHTGELRALRDDEEMPSGFDRIIGKRLESIASLKIERAAPAPAFVNLRSQSPLAAWAKKKRLAKIAAKSRRRNRK